MVVDLEAAGEAGALSVVSAASAAVEVSAALADFSSLDKLL